MASPGYELREAMRALMDDIGGGFDDEEPSGTLVEQLRELYGSNAKIADAAGAPTAAQAAKEYRARHGRSIESWNALSAAQRRRWERAGGTPDRGLETYRNGLTLKAAGEPWTNRPSSAGEKRAQTQARTRRQSFLRNLQRYENGTRRPRTTTARLERLRSERLEQLEGSSTFAGLAARFVEEGVTVSRLSSVTITVSNDTRERTGISKVTFGGEARVPLPVSFIDAVRANTWPAAAAIFFDAWGQAYGIGFVDIDEIGNFELEVGNDPDAYG